MVARDVYWLTSAGGHSQAREADCGPANRACVTTTRQYYRACPRSWPQWLLLTKRLEHRYSCEDQIRYLLHRAGDREFGPYALGQAPIAATTGLQIACLRLVCDRRDLDEREPA